MRFAFRLFISTGAPGCDMARENLDRIRTRIGEDHCEVEVVDIRQHPDRAELDRILALPTLLKLSPEPSLRMIGDLSDTDRILRAIGWPLSRTKEPAPA